MIVLHIAKILATISNTFMFVVLTHFMSSLSWSNKVERASIVGFAWMLGTAVLNTALLWAV